MNLVRWDPFRELDDMTERLNRFFGRPMLARTAETGKETSRRSGRTSRTAS